MTKRRSGTIGTLTATVAATLLIATGCGSNDSTRNATGGLDKLDATTILDRASSAASKQKSVHVIGKGTSDGEAVEIDMRFTRDVGGQGTFASGALRFEIVTTANDIYIKGGDAFYKQALGASYTANVSTLLAGKWIKAPKNDGRFGSLASITDMDGFLAQSLDPESDVTKADGKPIDGIPTVALRDGSGNGAGILYVANDGTDLPVSIQPEGDDTGSLKMTEWGTAAAPAPPAADQVVDISQLG